VSGSGISWAICKSAPHSRQITTPAPHQSVFYRPDALPAAQPTASKHWRQRIVITGIKYKYMHLIIRPLLQLVLCVQFSALTLAARWQKRQPACKSCVPPIPEVLFQNRWSIGNWPTHVHLEMAIKLVGECVYKFDCISKTTKSAPAIRHPYDRRTAR